LYRGLTIKFENILTFFNQSAIRTFYDEGPAATAAGIFFFSFLIILKSRQVT
jgi:hypothetical protein